MFHFWVFGMKKESHCTTTIVTPRQSRLRPHSAQHRPSDRRNSRPRQDCIDSVPQSLRVHVPPCATRRRNISASDVLQRHRPEIAHPHNVRLSQHVHKPHLATAVSVRSPSFRSLSLHKATAAKPCTKIPTITASCWQGSLKTMGRKTATNCERNRTRRKWMPRLPLRAKTTKLA